MPQAPVFPFVAVAGAPRARGRQYGEAARERVRRSAALYDGNLAALGLDAEDKRRLVAEFAEEIRRFDPAYLDEMRGIAEGAALALDDIVMINARTEVVARARRAAGSASGRATVPAEPDEGCTGAIVLPELTRDGELLHGQNWDWRQECAETSVVLRIARDDGPDILTFVEAGGLARSGLNAAGIAITANYLECDRDYSQSGVPLSLIRRKVLEQTDFAPTVAVVAGTPKSASNNIMLSMAEGFAVDLECAPDESFWIRPERGLIVHANHWLEPAARARLRETGLVNMPDSIYRDWRVRRLLEAKGTGLTLDDLRAALLDRFGDPFSVCRPPRPSLGNGNIGASVAMVLMQPARGVMEVAAVPALTPRFTRYSLTDDPQPVALPVALPVTAPAPSAVPAAG